jgi:hypothetical protein
MLDEIKIGSEVTDGFEEGIVVNIREIAPNSFEVDITDGKEAWTNMLCELALVEYPGEVHFKGVDDNLKDVKGN